MEKKKALAYIYFSQFTAKSSLAVTRDRNILISKMNAFGYEPSGLIPITMYRELKIL